jgi:hypothetical protein
VLGFVSVALGFSVVLFFALVFVNAVTELVVLVASLAPWAIDAALLVFKSIVFA